MTDELVDNMADWAQSGFADRLTAPGPLHHIVTWTWLQLAEDAEYFRPHRKGQLLIKGPALACAPARPRTHTTLRGMKDRA